MAGASAAAFDDARSALNQFLIQCPLPAQRPVK